MSCCLLPSKRRQKLAAYLIVIFATLAIVLPTSASAIQTKIKHQAPRPGEKIDLRDSRGSSIAQQTFTSVDGIVDVDNNRSSAEMRIKRAVLASGLYDKTSRPILNDADNVTVHIGISLYHIIDTKWYDAFLQWDPNEYNGVDKIWLPSDLLWIPDIVINNNADQEVKMQTNAIVSSNGDILLMYPQLVKIYCTLDVRNFPFDMQQCDIKFFSWTYNGNQIDLVTTETENPSYFDEANQEWDVISIRGKRNIATYACCPEPFPDISFAITLKRRSLFYIFNLIFPCMLIYAVAFLGFFLPIESNEKVNLEVTILLALVVFLMVIGETMPPSPDAIPLLGMLYAMTMVMVSIALLFAVAVTNVYYKERYAEQIPYWLFKVLYFHPKCPKCKMPQKMLCNAQFSRSTWMVRKRPFKNTNFMMVPSNEDFRRGSDLMPNGSAKPGGISSPRFGPNNCDPQTTEEANIYEPLFSKSPPANNRVTWAGTSTQNEHVVSNGFSNGGASLMQLMSPWSDNDEFAPKKPPVIMLPDNVKNRPEGSRADSPVWKHRNDGCAFDVWVPITEYQKHQQQSTFFPQQNNQNQNIQNHNQIRTSNHLRRKSIPLPEVPMYVQHLSENGTHHSRFVKTDAGCVHVAISWHEIAERLDSLLFWVFLVSSIVVFTLIFTSVDYEDPNQKMNVTS